MKKPEQIDQLTGLRFFAALLIFVWHLRGYFIPNDAFRPFFPPGAVPLFFVLSGFVLAVSGMRGRSWSDFFVARIARIWPAHIATIFLLVAVFWPWSKVYFQTAPSLGSLVLNIALLHDWIPVTSVFGGYNGVSWSISAEMFFYAIFPFVFIFARKSPVRLLVIASALVLAWITLLWTAFPSIERAWLGSMNPISGAWAFVVGVVCGTWYKRAPVEGFRDSAAAWTIIEIAVLVFAALANGRFLGIALDHIPPPMLSFFANIGPAPAYAALIATLALSNGLLARLLSVRLLVYLGEVSFSFYLVHQIIIRWYGDNASMFQELPISVRLAGVAIVSLLLSMLNYHLIELPSRRGIVSVWKSRSQKAASEVDAARGTS